MNSKLFNTRIVVIGLALLMLGSEPVLAGSSITLSGITGNSCLYSSFTADSVGNLTAVCNTSPPPPTLTPTCTLAASPSIISAGATSTLIASCSPAATSYAWTGTGTSSFTSSTSSGTVTPSTTTTYSVIGSNGDGPGNTASATVSISVPILIQQGSGPAPTSSSPVEVIKRWIYVFETLNFIPHNFKDAPVARMSYLKLIQAGKPTQYTLPRTW